MDGWVLSACGSALEGERAVWTVGESGVLGAEGEAAEAVGVEEVVLVVEGQRPEAAYWWEGVGGEGDGVAMDAVEAVAVGVEVAVEVAGLDGLVDEDVRLRPLRPG